jgi:adenosylmethionine-8-amino-7-oxononanoate aminotransferase
VALKPDFPLWHGVRPPSQLFAAISEADFFVEGEGIRVRDAGGRWYLDGRSCLWHATLGYSETRVIEAMYEQLRALPAGTLLNYDRPSVVAVEYAAQLIERLSPALSHVRFTLSGSQAIEYAVLLSRFSRKLADQPERQKVLALSPSYHGSGSVAGCITSYSVFHLDERSAASVEHLAAPIPDLGDADAVIEKIVHESSFTTAVVVEPILGATAHPLGKDVLYRLQDVCNENDVHFIVDEISTGFGRAGALSVAQDLELSPDLLLLGKGITAGYAPMAAVIVAEGFFQAHFTTSSELACAIGTTADGNPVAAAAASAVLRILDEDEIFPHVVDIGSYLADGLRDLGKKHAVVAEVRGAGLLLGLALQREDGTPFSAAEADAVRRTVEKLGLLLSLGEDGVLLAPPLVIRREECDEMVGILDEALATVS